MNKVSESSYWLDQARNINLIVIVLAVICAGLFIADFLYHKHGHFNFEHWPGFYAWYGFLSYCGIVLSAKLLRKVLQRNEDYYDGPADSESAAPPADNSQVQ